MVQKAWEYCLLICTPMTGLEEEWVRLAYQLVTPQQVKRLTVHSEDPSPLVAINRLLNELGESGWELVSYETSTNRGVFKRPKT
ncbi:MAG: hypothetical protein ACP5JJ_02525 [Anaerolineae bacterium]